MNRQISANPPTPRRTRLPGGRSIVPAALVGALALLLAHGCSSPTVAPEGQAPAPRIQASTPELAQLDERQRRRPDEVAMRAPPPPGLSEPGLEPPPAATPQRRDLTLAEVVEHAAEEAPSAPVADRQEDGVVTEALGAYLNGRLHRLTGAYDAALRDLKEAARLDPDASEPWREIAETQLAQGNRPGAMASFRRCQQRDPDNIRALEQLCAYALERREYEEALEFGARLWRQNLASHDPGLVYVAAARLGEAALGTGHLAAAADAFRIAASAPVPFGESTLYSRELGRLLRSKGALLEKAGDALMMLGRTHEALKSYEAAARSGGLVPDALVAKRVHSAMRAGRSALAASHVVESILASRGRVTVETLRMISYLRENTSLGTALADAIGATRELLPNAEIRAVAPGLIAAQAEALPVDGAVELLRREIVADPQNRRAISTLVLRLPAGDRRAIETIAEAIRAEPLLRRELTSALYASGIGAPELLETMIASEAPGTEAESGASATIGTTLLRATLLEDAARPNEALGILDEFAPEDGAPAPVGLLLARGELRDRLGDYEGVRSLIGLLRERDTPASRYAAASLSLQTGDAFGAWSMLEPVLEERDELDQVLATRLSLLAGRIRAEQRDFEAAARWYRRTIEEHPQIEEALTALVELYGTNGPLSNTDKLIEVLRVAAQVNESGPLVRSLRAIESIGAGRATEGETQLLESLSHNPANSTMLNTLVRFWVDRERYEQAIGFLREHLEKYPGDETAASLLGLVLHRDGRAEESAERLREWLATFPGDDGVSRAMEVILRSSPLEQRDEADRLVLERIARSAPSVVSELEKAEALRNLNRVDRLIATIDGLLDFPADQLDAHAERFDALLLGSVFKIGNAERVLDLFSRVTQARPGVSLSVYERYVSVLVGHEPTVELEALTAIVERAVAAHPDATEKIFQRLPIIVWEAASSGEMRAAVGPRVLHEKAAELAAWGARNVSPPSAEVFRIAFGLAEEFGQRYGQYPGSVRHVIAEARKAGIVEEAMRLAFGSDRDAMAGAFYEMAVILNDTEYDELVDGLYRLALEHNPEHAMALNNLAYRMLEREEDPEEAHEMAQRSYRLVLQDGRQIDDASVIDTLGWARYKLGWLEDEPVEAGDAGRINMKKGAISLLQDALDLSQKAIADAREFSRTNVRTPEHMNRVFRYIINQSVNRAILADHLGDALWAAGRREEAVAAWEKATASPESLRESVNAVSPFEVELPEDLPADLIEVRDAAMRKTRATREDREPAIAPMHRPVRTTDTDGINAGRDRPAPGVHQGM